MGLMLAKDVEHLLKLGRWSASEALRLRWCEAHRHMFRQPGLHERTCLLIGLELLSRTHDLSF